MRVVIGTRLRELRSKQKPEVTLEDLAGRLAARGVTLDRSAIGRIENHNRYVLDYELKALVFNALALHFFFVTLALFEVGKLTFRIVGLLPEPLQTFLCGIGGGIAHHDFV
jgi:hypothetical protein